jgi:hypothetical protein
MPFDMKDYARRGAQSRIAELQEELKAIYGAFPELREGTARRGRPATAKVVINHEEQFTSRRPGVRAAATGGAPEAAARKTRRRRKMTAAQRKAVGERMRKYWAAKKKTARA